jgi:uncharacterized protein (TIGR02246 family)
MFFRSETPMMRSLLVGLLAAMLYFTGYVQGLSADAVPAGIEALHQRDREATLSGDPDALRMLWTDDAVRVSPGEQAEVGLEQINRDDSATAAKRPKGAGFVSYQATIKNVEVHGDVAVEWGFFDCTYKNDPKGPLIQLRGNVLRVLKRQGNGEWRFSHVMWNSQASQ